MLSHAKDGRMQDVMKGRRGLVASAAVVILLIMGFLFATAPNWRSLLTGNSEGRTSSSSPTSVSPPSSPPPAVNAGLEGKASGAATPPQPGSTGTAGQQQANVTEPPPGLKTPQSGPTADQASGSTGTADSAGAVPSFDIVRVEPSGDSVIAARGAPNADVVLLDGDVPIAQAKADANGQVALLPPPLKPGEHSLTLTTTGPGGKTVSSQSIAVSMSGQAKTPPLVALIQPNQPATILSGPVAGNSPASGKTDGSSTPPTTPTPPPTDVVIRSVEVESFGSFFASGKAPPGSASRIYLNGAFVATVTADGKGNWSLKINKGMKPGRYAVRIDQTDPGGKVIARAEVPFDYPSQVASASARPDSAKKNTISKPAGPSGQVIVGSNAPPGSTVTAPAGQGAEAGVAVRPNGAGRTGRSDTAAYVNAGSPGRTPVGGAALVAGAASDVAGSSGSAPGAGAKPPSASPAKQKGPAAEAQNTAKSQTVVASNDSGQGSRVASGSGAPVASDGAQPSASSGIGQGDSSVPTVVAELVTAKVIRGDSLWRISRQMLGHGMRYTQIYAANTQQIRDPRLIYPGQVFVLPQQ